MTPFAGGYSSVEVYDSPPWVRESRRPAPKPRLFYVQVFVKHEDGTSSRVRKRLTDCSRTVAFHWGKRREAELRGAVTSPALTPPPAAEKDGETVTKWFGRYHEEAEKGTVGRKNNGDPQVAVKERRSRFAIWIAPNIGYLPVTGLRAAHLRPIVRKLEDAVRHRRAFYRGEVEREGGRKPGITAKTAKHIWSELTSGIREALSSNDDSLRVLVDDPLRGVQAPRVGNDDRDQAALYPDEVVQLLACEDVPMSRRRVYAVAIYTGMRRSELARLRASDIDFEHGLITVRGKKTTAAKRQVPIEPALRPLLQILCHERKTGPLLDAPRADGKGGSSDLTKKDLERSKLTRADLSRDDGDHMPFTFHGFRHTAITHWVVAGRNQLWLLLTAGHMDVQMTRRYLGKAEVLRATFGTPHPPLPASVLGGAIVVPFPQTG